MKATLQPISFTTEPDQEFTTQLTALKSLLAGEADFLETLPLGAALPEQADGVVFPQVLGEAYRRMADFKALQVPILVITSEFGTVSMWDWEINRYLALEGVRVSAPYNLEQARMLCRALGVRKELLPGVPGQPRGGFPGGNLQALLLVGRRVCAAHAG
jgi:hypothetical protein